MLDGESRHIRLLLRCLSFLVTLIVTSNLLYWQRMGVKDLIGKFANSKLDGSGQRQNFPPPVPHNTRPANPHTSVASNERSFVVVRNGKLELENGTSFRFASLNAPELLDGHDFETEDTMRTLSGLGRRVTRTYTLKIKGTSPHFGDAGHINGWDSQTGDWIYDEGKFRKVQWHILCKPPQVNKKRS